MSTLADDTWGIPGPQFLQIYLIVAVGAVVLAVLLRTMVTMGSGSRDAHLSPTEVGYLAGGRTRAVQAALAGLRAADAVGAGAAGTLFTRGGYPGGDDLTYAVYGTLGRRVTLADMPYDSGVATALDRMRDRLVQAGLLLSGGQRALARAAALLVFAVGGLGIARTVAGAANHKPVTFLVLATIPTFLVGLLMLRAPRSSRAGRRAVTRQRRGASHLAPGRKPAWSTYGMAGAALGVALYGTAALWAADPAFATAAGVPVLTTGGGGSSDGGSSSSCSSGSSSCGGGGCGGGGCGG
jgi:uncharacterized protein (TIGR04222 family)